MKREWVIPTDLPDFKEDLEIAPLERGDHPLKVMPSAFLVEVQTLFEKSWQFVGHESEYQSTGDYVAASIVGNPAIIVRGNDGPSGQCVPASRRTNCDGRWSCENASVQVSRLDIYTRRPASRSSKIRPERVVRQERLWTRPLEA